MISLLVFCIIGRVCIFLLQKFPLNKLLPRFFSEGKFLHDLFECDLCLGVWVYWILAYPFKMNILNEYFYVPVLSELLTGGSISLLVHLIRLGWEAKFSVIEVR